jgi:hypothetical protein
VQGIFEHNFQCKKVHTILDKIWYLSAAPLWQALALLTKIAADWKGLLVTNTLAYLTHSRATKEKGPFMSYKKCLDFFVSKKQTSTSFSSNKPIS